MAWLAEARPGRARYGLAGQGMVSRGKVRLGSARWGKGRHLPGWRHEQRMLLRGAWLGAARQGPAWFGKVGRGGGKARGVISPGVAPLDSNVDQAHAV